MRTPVQRSLPAASAYASNRRSTAFMTAEAGAPPSKASLKAWWNQFTFAQRSKKVDTQKGEPPHFVFGKPLRESLKYASVQISTANANGELYVWGYIPVVVAKCGLYLKENATEVEGTFRVNGSNKRMRELQAIFETPPRYGKSLDWQKESWTTHDVASVFRRYLTQMPEPVIPVNLYHDFRNALARRPHDQDEVIATYKRLIHSMPRANQYLLLYVLDLLSVFARKSSKNRMDAANLAVIFRPGLLSHPDHELSPREHQLSQEVLEFLIAHQDWFMLDIPPPPRNDSVVLGAPSSPVASGSGSGSGISGLPSSSATGALMSGPAAASQESWEREVGAEAERGGSVVVVDEFGVERRPGGSGRRRVVAGGSGAGDSNGLLSPVEETPPETIAGSGEVTVSRSRTLPSSRPGRGGSNPTGSRPDTADSGVGVGGATGVSRSSSARSVARSIGLRASGSLSRANSARESGTQRRVLRKPRPPGQQAPVEEQAPLAAATQAITEPPR